LSSFKIKEIHFRQKDEAWVREHYSHIPESAMPRNIDLFEAEESIGIEIESINKIAFKNISDFLRSERRVTPTNPERNQIHVPDSIEISEKEKELFLNG
jgi:hypothetical protein